MSVPKTFSLSQANALLPKLKSMINTANQEITTKAEALANAYAVYEKSEQEMNLVTASKSSKVESANDNNYSELRQCRLKFQDTIESLSLAKKTYMQALNFWYDEITDTGVIKRYKIRTT